MATPAAALGASAIGQAAQEALAPIVVTFGGDGFRVPFTQTRGKRKKNGVDNRVLVRSIEIPAGVYLPFVAYVLVPLLQDAAKALDPRGEGLDPGELAGRFLGAVNPIVKLAGPQAEDAIADFVDALLGVKR